MNSKYIIYIDYKADLKANGHESIEYIKSTAKTLIEAIAEADTLYNDDVYLIRILEKSGKVEKVENYKQQQYTAVMARRCAGWHLNTEEECEQEHKAVRSYGKGWETIEAV